MKFSSVLITVIILVSITGCGSPAPLIQDTTHFEFEFCKPYTEAWSTSRDVLLGHEFELIGSYRDDGFVRSNWMYKEYPDLGLYIRTRFSVNFLPYRNVARVTPDVEFLQGDPILYKNIPIVKEVLTEMDQRLQCIGDENHVTLKGTPPATR